jgi:hypothetical protein
MDKVEEMFTDTRGIFEKVNTYNIHDYMSIVDVSDQRLMTVLHQPRWISVLNCVLCRTINYFR